MRSALHHSSPQIFSLAVYRLRGDCKSPGFIGRTFFTADCKSAGTPDGCKSAGTPDGCKSAGTPDGCKSAGAPDDCKSAGTPNGRQTPDGSVRNPWSKNALLIQRNPMKKYPGKRLRVYTLHNSKKQ